MNSLFKLFTATSIRDGIHEGYSPQDDTPFLEEPRPYDTKLPNPTPRQRIEWVITYIDDRSQYAFATKSKSELWAESIRWTVTTSLVALQIRRGRPRFVAGRYTTTGKYLRHASLAMSALNAAVHTYETVRRLRQKDPHEVIERQLSKMVDSAFAEARRVNR